MFERAKVDWSRIDTREVAAQIERGEPHAPCPYIGPVVTIEISVSDDRPVVDAITVRRNQREDSPEVSGRVLAAIPFTELTTRAIQKLYQHAAAEDKGHRVSSFQEALEVSEEADAAADRATSIRRRRSITDELLQEVAAIYSTDTTGKPTEAVAKALFTSHRNASRYAGLARDAGFLKDGTARKAKE
jgi:hypothetical protein